MIDLYYWTTPNGHKLTIFLEEAGIPYRLVPVNIGQGDQFKPEFLKISPNNKIPAIMDHAPADGGAPLPMFESGAILLYLADKIGRFIPRASRARLETIEWLFWQMANLGPMAGQTHHFRLYAPEKIPYAIERYTRENSRLYAVLDKRLAGREFIVDEYSIADIACFPWIQRHDRQGVNLDDFPDLARWFRATAARPAVVRAYEIARKIHTAGALFTEEEKRVLFGQDASTVRRS